MTHPFHYSEFKQQCNIQYKKKANRNPNRKLDRTSQKCKMHNNENEPRGSLYVLCAVQFFISYTHTHIQVIAFPLNMKSSETVMNHGDAKKTQQNRKTLHFTLFLLLLCIIHDNNHLRTAYCLLTMIKLRDKLNAC